MGVLGQQSGCKLQSGSSNVSTLSQVSRWLQVVVANRSGGGANDNDSRGDNYRRWRIITAAVAIVSGGSNLRRQIGTAAAAIGGVG